MTIALSTFDLVEPVDAAIAPVRQPDHPDADVARAAGGDVQAFERLYAANAGRVHALVRRMLTPAEADETVQDVFVRAWAKLDTFRGESAFSTWLHRLAVNVCLARRQTASRDRRRFLEDETALVAAPAPRRTPELSIDVEAALARLPDGMRRVLVLHDIEGFTHEEIAEQFGIAVGTSKSQLHRARLALRPMLER
jgi:RNA polymerase sigma-70 factor (ECF subfamily)